MKKYIFLIYLLSLTKSKGLEISTEMSRMKWLNLEFKCNKKDSPDYEKNIKEAFEYLSHFDYNVLISLEIVKIAKYLMIQYNKKNNAYINLKTAYSILSKPKCARLRKKAKELSDYRLVRIDTKKLSWRKAVQIVQYYKSYEDFLSYSGDVKSMTRSPKENIVSIFTRPFDVPNGFYRSLLFYKEGHLPKYVKNKELRFRLRDTKQKKLLYYKIRLKEAFNLENTTLYNLSVNKVGKKLGYKTCIESIQSLCEELAHDEGDDKYHFSSKHVKFWLYKKPYNNGLIALEENKRYLNNQKLLQNQGIEYGNIINMDFDKNRDIDSSSESKESEIDGQGSLYDPKNSKKTKDSSTNIIVFSFILISLFGFSYYLFRSKSKKKSKTPNKKSYSSYL